MKRLFYFCECKMRWMALCCALMISSMVGAQEINGISTVQLTSANDRIGMIFVPGTPTDETIITLKPGDSFTLMAGTLSTGGYSFDGAMAVALVRPGVAGDELVEILARRAMKITNDIPMEIFKCKVGENTTVKNGDVIRLLTTLDGNEYKIVSKKVGQGVTDQIPAVGYNLPMHKINIPLEVPGATVRLGEENLWADKVVEGCNFYFYIDKDSPESVMAVKANGQTLTPASSGLYGLMKVNNDFDVTIKVYEENTFPLSKVITCTETVRVADLLTEAEMDCLKGLKVSGPLKEADFEVFREQMSSLEILDLTETVLENDWLPTYAFENNGTIKEVKLPESVKGSGNNAFRFMKKLEFIVLPAGFSQFGLNEFFGCESLKKVWVKWNPFDNGMTLGFPIPPCAFRATTIRTDGTLIVPKGCVQAYDYASNWGDFKTIREEKPVDKVLMEKPFEKYFPTSVVQTKAGGLEIYPAEGGCWVMTNGQSNMTVVVYDLSGRIEKQLLTKEAHTFVALPSGCHLVRVGDSCRKVMVR